MLTTIYFLHTVVDVSAQCTITPLNPTTLTATGGALVNGTVNVMIQCVCPYNWYLRWFDTNGNYLVKLSNKRYVADSPYSIQSTTYPYTDVTLVIPTFNDSYAGTYTCGVRATVNLTIGELMINTVSYLYVAT